MSPDPAFLRKFRPDGCTTYLAIVPDGQTAAATFNGADPAKTARWIESKNEFCGIYFTVNGTSPGLCRKPAKEDITTIEGFWSDVDPRGGQLDQERKRLAQLADSLCQLAAPPTLIIDSGNGIQPIWMLAEPLEATPEYRDAADALCARLEVVLGGKGTHNCDRVLRVPGTVNYPNKKKRALGRGEVQARLLHATWQRYTWRELEELAAHLERHPPEHAVSIADRPRHGPREPMTPEELNELRRSLTGETPDGWLTAMLKMIGRLVRDGAPDWFIKDWALQYRWPEYTEAQTLREIEPMIAGARKKGFAPEREDAPQEADDPELPRIHIFGGSLPKNVSAAERALATATTSTPAAGVYQRGGALVRVAWLPAGSAADGIRRAAGTMQTVTAGSDFLRLRLTEVATWESFNKRTGKWVKQDAPAAVARTLADIAGMWPSTPPLAGIVEAPALRPDGTILERPGYDVASGLYFDPGAVDFLPIPERPSRRDAIAALDLLLEIIEDFPFFDEPSKSVALAALITPLIRHAVRAAPLTAISAPKMGTGKTLLSHLPAYIATGRPPALMAQADTPEEEKKRLLALLLEGSVVTVLDNCERPVKSDMLCTALTETVIRDRLLGSTRTVTVPTATTWIATGNNLSVDGDLSSRTLLCTLDPECERPEEREFSVNLHADVPARRAELARAVLTIVRAYLVAGSPRPAIPTFGRFEAWSAVAREPLAWLGFADPCETRSEIEARDPVRDKLGNLLEAWHDAFAHTDQTVAAAIQLTVPATDPATRDLIPLGDTAQALRNALEAIGDDRGKINGRRVENFLMKHERRIERGYRLYRAGARQGVALWSVTPC